MPRSGMNQRRVWMGVAGLAVAAAAAAQPEAPRAPLMPGATSPAAGESAARALTRRETLDRLAVTIDVAFEGQPLHDVVRYLSLLAGVPLEPLWIEDAGEAEGEPGLDPMLPIDLDARGETALACLDLILAYAADAQRLDLGASWQFNASGVIELGPKDRLNRPAARRVEVYDVQDLLATFPPPPEAPRLNVSQALQAAGRGGGGGGGWVFPNDTAGPPAPPENGDNPPVTPVGRLINLITASVEPDQWVVNGGDAGMIEFHDGVLIVLAPDYVHRGLVGPLGPNQPVPSNQTSTE